MLVRLQEPAVASELAAYLRGFDCSVVVARATELHIAFAQAPPVDGRDPAWLERIRLEGYVRTWNALHPATTAVIAEHAAT